MSLQQLRQTWPVKTVRVAGTDVEVIHTPGPGARTGPPGTPVVLLPGAQGTAESWLHQLLAWGRQREMLSVNYPGLADPAALADLVVEVANAQGLGVFDIIGSSYGGYLAQWIGVRHAARVRRIVIGNSFHDPRPSQSADKLAGLEGKTPDEVKSEALARLQAAPDSEFKQIMLDLMGQRQDAATLRGRMLAVQKAPLLPALPVPAQRLMLIECDNDPLIGPPVREAIRQHYAGARHCAIGGGGHYPYILKAAEYNAAVAAFLDAP